MTGPGKSPSWNGARIAAYWPGGTPPRNTSVSVPRLTPDRSVRTSTSSAPGLGQRDRPDLPAAGLAQPERACVVVDGAHLGRSSARRVPDTLHEYDARALPVSSAESRTGAAVLAEAQPLLYAATTVTFAVALLVFAQVPLTVLTPGVDSIR